MSSVIRLVRSLRETIGGLFISVLAKVFTSFRFGGGSSGRHFLKQVKRHSKEINVVVTDACYCDGRSSRLLKAALESYLLVQHSVNGKADHNRYVEAMHSEKYATDLHTQNMLAKFNALARISHYPPPKRVQSSRRKKSADLPNRARRRTCFRSESRQISRQILPSKRRNCIRFSSFRS